MAATEKHFALRLPFDLWEDVQRLAAQDERSANWTVVRLLREAVLARRARDETAA